MVFNVVGSSFANASFVGAKTVNGPSPDKAPVKLAATKASTRVLNSGVCWAISTMLSEELG